MVCVGADETLLILSGGRRRLKLGSRAIARQGDVLRAVGVQRAKVCSAPTRHPHTFSMPARAILVSGASGLVGSALVPELEHSGHRVVRLVRRDPANANERRWNPSAHLFDE